MANTNSFSDYSRVQLRDHYFRTNTFAKPAVIAIALASAAPTDAATGAAMNEIGSGIGYTRQSLNPSNANWSGDSTTNGTAYNNSVITYNQATADWGWVSGVVIADNATIGAGNALFYGTLTTPKIIQNQDIFTIPISGIQVVMN